MREKNVFIKNFRGTSYEAGTQIGTWVLSQPELLQRALLPPGAYPAGKFAEITKLLDQYCGGINEEIRGFSDTVGITPEQAVFYAMTYLERGCSLMAALPGKTENGHTMMARSYDFCDEMEEMCFAYTDVSGKYSHIGSTLNLFGRCDGMNEHGLAACIAGNGLPVGNFEGGRKAGVTGFSFWIAIRSILENCKDVEEAVRWTMDAPIAFNLNLMLADAQNRIGLVQCVAGHKGFEILDGDSEKSYLGITNHVIMEELKQYEAVVIDNSVARLGRIREMFEQTERVSGEELKTLLSASYPEGLCCHYYKEFFGTLRSMVFDVNERMVEMTFGSPQVNEWHKFPVGALEEQEIRVVLPDGKAAPEFYSVSHRN